MTTPNEYPDRDFEPDDLPNIDLPNIDLPNIDLPDTGPAAEDEATADPGVGEGARVVDFATARQHHRAGLPAPDPDGDPDGDDDPDPAGPAASTEDDEDADVVDHESVLVERAAPGRPVDPPDEPVPWLSRRVDRRPVLPAWAASRADAIASARYLARGARHTAAYHAVRAPKYAAKTAVYAPVGIVRTIGRVLAWASAERHNFELRQHAANRGDSETWLRLDARRQQQARWRWMLLVLAGLPGLLLVLGVLLFAPIPAIASWGIWAGVAAVFARLGRPADKPITDRVTAGRAYRKLTAELVRRALLSCQIGALNSAAAKDPAAISFPTEIHRDGPGHMAIVDLPYGVVASDVVARRDKLASGLRLPLDQVWPEPAPGHTGRLALWVGFEPSSQMTQPAWPLAAGGKVDVFKPFPFATDPRMRQIVAEVMYRNWLFGGQPGSGKTWSMRTVLLACALDPRTEIRGYNLKGTGDFTDLEPLMAEHGNGIDDDTIGAAAALLDWLWDECQRRARRINHYAKLGKAPDNKVTPELADLKGSGLHPLVAWIDEAQNLFAHKDFGKKAGEVAEKVIKLGRALGIILILGTQIPDKDSLPTGITRNVNTRFCLSVMDQTANDMILGTSMYKNGYRATVFEPVTDAGWGVAVGLGKPASLFSYGVDNPTTKKVVARAIAYRTAAGTMPDPDQQERQPGPGYDVLADVATIWPADQDKAWNETLIERLADYRPDVYTGWKPEQLTAALAVHDVRVTQIGRRNAEGKTVNRRGPARTDILTAIAERNRKRAAE